MEYNKEKVDEIILALLYLNIFEHQKGFGAYAWKGHDWDHLDRLHEKGLISNPKKKNKTVCLSEEAVDQAKELFKKYFINES